MVLEESGLLMDQERHIPKSNIPAGRLAAIFGTLVILSVAFLSAENARAQRPDLDFGKAQLGDINFSLDWAEFRSESPDSTLLEIYYKIPNSGLSFEAVDSGYEANYEISISVYKKKSRVANEEIRRRLFVEDIARTTLYTDFVLNTVSFNLRPGKYKIQAILRDLNSDQQRKLEHKIKVKKLSGGRHPKLSAIEFLYSADFDDENTAFFRKGDVTAVPLVDRSLRGGEEGGPVLFYFEIYAGSDTKLNALIDTRISHISQGLVYRDTIYALMDKPVTRQIRKVDLTDFRPGEYEISIEVIARRKKVTDRRIGAFRISWSLMAMVEHDYETVLDQLESIATHEEMKTLKKAKSVDGRVRAWTDFWAGRDPTPDTEGNEARVSFYYRVRYANKFFSGPKRIGWRSPRGEVLLRYGPPDESIDDPIPADAISRQIWYYYNYGGEPLRFIFVDRFGDDDFQLLYPYDGRIR